MSKTSPQYNNVPCLLYVGAPTPNLLRRIGEIPGGTSPYGKVQDWAFTWTVDPKNPVIEHNRPYGKCPLFVQYDYLKSQIYVILHDQLESLKSRGTLEYLKVEKVDVYFETTTNGQLHAHGVVRAMFKTSVVLQVLHRHFETELGRCLIEYMHDNSEWLNYCLKSQDSVTLELFPPAHWDGISQIMRNEYANFVRTQKQIRRKAELEMIKEEKRKIYEAKQKKREEFWKYGDNFRVRNPVDVVSSDKENNKFVFNFG